MEVKQALHSAIQQLNCDMDQVKNRLSIVESQLQKEGDGLNRKPPTTAVLGELSGPTTAFVIVWPFVAFALLKMANK